VGGGAAGIVATAAQIVLWWLTSASVQIVRKTEERRVRPHIIMLKELFLNVAFATLSRGSMLRQCNGRFWDKTDD
jgi:hypothetical protein